MSKIVKVDQEQLSKFKWRKCPLGVIHPEHTPVNKTDNDDSFSDLIITAKPAQLSSKPSWVPKPSVPIKREVNSERRPKSAKPGTDIVQEALNSIPQARPERKNFFRTSMIAGRDLKNSIIDFKSHLSNKKSEITHKKTLKVQYLKQADQIDQLLADKFKTAKISDAEYSELKDEIEKLTREYDLQLSKQKIIINFLALKEDNLDLQELNRMFADIQLKKEKQLILLQHFVLRLKEETVNKARSLIAYVAVDSVSKALDEFSKAQHDRTILIEFLEKVKIQLRKDGMDKDSDQFLPFGCIEKVITDIYTKWEKEKEVLEGFLNDIMTLFCDEFNLTKEAVIASKVKNKRETELKVVAEFINMYLNRLHISIESKIKRLEYLKEIVINGKPASVPWSQVLLKFVKFDPKKPQSKSIGSALFNKSSESQPNPSKAQTSPNKSKPKSKSPPQKKLSPTREPLKKSNVGKSAQKFKSSNLSSIPEEKKTRPQTSSKALKNPSKGKNESSLDEDIDDIISDLNPSKPATESKGKLSGLFGLGSKSSSSTRKVEMDSSEGLFQFKQKQGQSRVQDSRESREPREPREPRESREVFTSVDAPLMRSVEKPQADYVFRSISDIENIRFPKKPPETRSEFIKSGIKQFSPYMDAEGNYFDPKVKFPNIKPSEVDPLDPYFLESIGNLSPDPSRDWFVRSHHLRSFTGHPLSVNDNPNYYKAQMQVNLKEETQNAGVDMRDQAIDHLEKTLEDLKCELNSRKREVYVSSFDQSDAMNGNLAKVITPVGAGLNTREKEGLVLHTYESILEELRARERAILNQKRMEIYEKNRPPQEKWYELKSNEFTDEIQRHMNSLKPREEHRHYLNHLAIPDLY